MGFFGGVCFLGGLFGLVGLIFVGGGFTHGAGAGGVGGGADVNFVSSVVYQHEDTNDSADECCGNEDHGESPVGEAGGVTLNAVLSIVLGAVLSLVL